MGICPLCNGILSIEIHCFKCNTLLEHQGKVTDFLDPYSHYNDNDIVKLADGYQNTFKYQICPHIFICPTCGEEKVHFIKEQK